MGGVCGWGWGGVGGVGGWGGWVGGWVGWCVCGGWVGGGGARGAGRAGGRAAAHVEAAAAGAAAQRQQQAGGFLQPVRLPPSYPNACLSSAAVVDNEFTHVTFYTKNGVAVPGAAIWNNEVENSPLAQVRLVADRQRSVAP